MVQLCQNHWKTIDGNGGQKKNINHSITLKNWPSLWSNSQWSDSGPIKRHNSEWCIFIYIHKALSSVIIIFLLRFSLLLFSPFPSTKLVLSISSPGSEAQNIWLGWYSQIAIPVDLCRRPSDLVPWSITITYFQRYLEISWGVLDTSCSKRPTKPKSQVP